MFTKLFLFFISLFATAVFAQTKKELPPVNFKVKDITPDFLAFYDSATKMKASEEERWELWKKMYHFAAVPPTPQGDSIARKLLNNAWSKYPAVMPLIKKGAAVITPGATKMVYDIAKMLRPDSALDITLQVYVGGFEGNAFNMARKRKVTMSVAIETPMPKRSVVMTHELAHAVHIGMGKMSGDWIRSVGAIIVSEGLAMHVSKKLLPGFSDKLITEYSPGWLSKANTRRTEILKNILPYVSSELPADVMRFTMGNGSTGLEREAYYAGWVVIGYRLKQGMSFLEIAHIDEKDMPQFVRETIEMILTRHK